MPDAENPSTVVDTTSSPAHSRGWLKAAALGILLGITSILKHLPAWWNGRHAVHSWTWDIDTGLIWHGLLKAPNFFDTLRWWTGPWVGEVPFYRPLTSYLFWFEWKVFGEREWLWMVPGFLAHIAATSLFALFVFRLAQRFAVASPHWAALVSAWGFCGFLLSGRADVTSEVFNYWKNQPDSYSAACCLASLLFYINAREKQRSLPFSAAAWYLLGCCFKEIVVPLPLLCIALEGRSDFTTSGRPGLRRAATMAAAGILFLVVRSAALHSVGYTYGSDSQWLQRTAQELLGPFSATMIAGEWLGNAVGVVTFLGIMVFLRSIRNEANDTVSGQRTMNRNALMTFIAILCGWAVLGALRMATTDEFGRTSVLSPIGPMVGLLRCLQPATSSEILSTLILLTAIAVLWKNQFHALLIAVVWTIAFLAPLTLSPGPLHRYYLSQGGYYLVYGLTAGILAPMALHHARTLIRWGPINPEIAENG